MKRFNPHERWSYSLLNTVFNGLSYIPGRNKNKSIFLQHHLKKGKQTDAYLKQAYDIAVKCFREMRIAFEKQ